MRKLVIGLTGGIGAGKTLALREFARLGARTLALDEVARELSRPGRSVHRAVVRAFGPGVLSAAGALDRARLARLAFAKPAMRRRLERAAHPPILAEMRRRLAAGRGGVFVVDVPLLFEGGHERRFDLTLAVRAAPALRRARVRRRDGLSPADVRARLAAQWPEDRRAARADLVVANEGSASDFKSRIRQYYRAFDLMSRGGAAAHGG